MSSLGKIGKIDNPNINLPPASPAKEKKADADMELQSAVINSNKTTTSELWSAKYKWVEIRLNTFLDLITGFEKVYKVATESAEWILKAIIYVRFVTILYAPIEFVGFAKGIAGLGKNGSFEEKVYTGIILPLQALTAYISDFMSNLKEVGLVAAKDLSGIILTTTIFNSFVIFIALVNGFVNRRNLMEGEKFLSELQEILDREPSPDIQLEKIKELIKVAKPVLIQRQFKLSQNELLSKLALKSLEGLSDKGIKPTIDALKNRVKASNWSYQLAKVAAVIMVISLVISYGASLVFTGGTTALIPLVASLTIGLGSVILSIYRRHYQDEAGKKFEKILKDLNNNVHVNGFQAA